MVVKKPVARYNNSRKRRERLTMEKFKDKIKALRSKRNIGEYLNVRVYTYGFEARGSVTLLFYGTPILRFSYKDYGKNININ